MTGFDDRLLRKLPAGRSPSTEEYRQVMDYVEFVLALCEKDMPRVLPEYAGDWYHTLVLALQVTILLREGKLTRGPVTRWYGMARRENWLAYADHYLQMRADAFNLGPAGLPTLQSAVFNLVRAQMGPRFGPRPGVGARAAPTAPPSGRGTHRPQQAHKRKGAALAAGIVRNFVKGGSASVGRWLNSQ